MTQGGSVWNRQEPLGISVGGTTFGTVAAPLLAGFSLSSVIALADARNGGFRGDVAIAAFTASAGLLVFAIQSTIQAGRYQVSPADRLAWYPEARAAENLRAWMRRTQWRDERLAARHRARARHTYNGGILGFLAGLVAVLIPDPGDWTAMRDIALAFGVVALLVELILVTGHPTFIRQALHPDIEDDAEPQDGSGMPELPDEFLTWLIPEFAPADSAPPDWTRLTDVLSALEQRLAMLPPAPNAPAGPPPEAPQPVGGRDGVQRPTLP